MSARFWVTYLYSLIIYSCSPCELYTVCRGVDLVERKLVIHIQILGLQNILPA